MLTGISLSFVPKNKSTDVIKTPPTSSTKNDCASGSIQPTNLLVSLVDVLVICLSSATLSLTILNSLVEPSLSKIPLAI